MEDMPSFASSQSVVGNRPKRDFRTDINGLRAVAVLSVIFYHFRIPPFSGGYAGVDVFFVISGFLMTLIIVRGIDGGGFRISSFYASRFKRIVPALAVMCLAVLAVGSILVDPQTYSLIGRNVVSSLLFVSNFDYASKGGYFSSPPTSNWMLHTWSLSVEWQFYIIYPLFLILLQKARLGGLRRAYVLAFVACASFLLSVAALFSGSDLALRLTFFLLPARAWEMILGGLVVFIPEIQGGFIRLMVLIAGGTLILVSVLGMFRHLPWPGFAALAPTLGTALIIAVRATNSWWLRLTATQHIGTWSYSIYLWHWPLVAMIYYLGLQSHPVISALGIVISILLGALSYHFVERQAKNTIFGQYVADLTPIFVVAGAVLTIGVGVFLSRGLESIRMRLAAPGVALALQRIRQAETDWTFPNNCRPYFVSKSGLQYCKVGGGGPVEALVIGDSYAQQLEPRYALLPRGPGRRGILFLTKAGCPFLPRAQLIGSVMDCASAAEEALKLAVSGRYPRVIVAVSWIGSVGQDPDDAERGRICYERGMFCRTSTNPTTYLGDAEWAFDGLGSRLNQARLRGAKVFILGVFPTQSGIAPGDLYRRLYETGSPASNIYLDVKAFWKRAAYPDQLVRRTSAKSGAALVEPLTYMCHRSCPLLADGVPLFYDISHLRAMTVAGPDLAFLDTLTGLTPAGAPWVAAPLATGRFGSPAPG